MRSAPWGHVYPQGHFTGLLRYCRTIPVALIPQPLLPPVIRQEKGSTQHSHPARLLRRSHPARLSPPFSCRITGGRRGWG